MADSGLNILPKKPDCSQKLPFAFTFSSLLNEFFKAVKFHVQVMRNEKLYLLGDWV
jgi:hypothetical protein